MRFRLLLRLALLPPLFLAACGDLPEPFLGNPGATARRLAVPATPLLVVPPPSKALLPAPAETDYADLLALSLQKEEVPSLARPAHKGDWALLVTAERQGDSIIPHYAIDDPNGKQLGVIDGAPTPAPGWITGAPWTLGQAAHDAVPKVLALMLSLRATRDRANPNSLLNRAARVYVPEVQGAPGDGDTALSRLIRAQLAQFGPLVQVTPEGADFVVQGQVKVTNVANAQQRVEIVWTVSRPSGVVNGKVSQLHDLPAGTVDRYWGDIAGAVTQEASGGIDEVIERFIDRAGNAPGAAGAGATPGASPAAGTRGSGQAPAATGTPVTGTAPTPVTSQTATGAGIAPPGSATGATRSIGTTSGGAGSPGVRPANVPTAPASRGTGTARSSSGGPPVTAAPKAAIAVTPTAKPGATTATVTSIAPGAPVTPTGKPRATPAPITSTAPGTAPSGPAGAVMAGRARPAAAGTHAGPASAKPAPKPSAIAKKPAATKPPASGPPAPAPPQGP
jgi:hypothetical protein